MAIEIVLSDALAGHVEDCPNIDALDTRITTLEQADTEFSGKVSAIQGVIPGTATPTNKLITASDLQTGINSVYVPGAMIYRGVLADSATIQAVVSPAAGDYYQAADTGMFWIYNGTDWQSTTNMVDLGDYYTKPEVDTLVSAESEVLEAEIKKILDDYAAEHGMDVNEWKSCLSANATGAGNVTLDVDLQEVGATEVMFFVRASGVSGFSFVTTSIVMPITDKFYPQTGRLVSSAGGSYNDCAIPYRDSASTISLSTVYFQDYKTIYFDGGTTGTLSGVFYRSAKPNTVIQYHNDATLEVYGEQGVNWAGQSRTQLAGSSYLPSISDGTTMVYGEPYLVPFEGYMRVMLSLRGAPPGYKMVMVSINGQTILQDFTSNDNETTPDQYNVLCQVVRVNAGDSIRIGLDQRVAGNIPWNTSYCHITMFPLLEPKIVEASVADAFNQHTQNTDIHVTSAEKVDIDKVPEAINMITTLSNEIAGTTVTANQAESDIAAHTKADADLYANMYATLYHDILQAAKDVYAGTLLIPYVQQFPVQSLLLPHL